MSPTASSSRSVIRSLPRALESCSPRRIRPATTAFASASAPVHPDRARTTTSIIPRSRGFFSLPDISKLASNLTSPSASGEGQDGRGVETDGEMQKFHARKILPYVSPSAVTDMGKPRMLIFHSSQVLTGSALLARLGRAVVLVVHTLLHVVAGARWDRQRRQEAWDEGLEAGRSAFRPGCRVDGRLWRTGGEVHFQSDGSAI